ncbi:hypothetical protein QFZ26_003222 [Agromyces ramosus]|uniref:SGNH hydrolase-type esterase domain-containing protein n=1 Tax=Agromyces ramosus TaxID=33879 RepID=A0ABU0RC62_9MICO|nr:hypothetical protein [Agromyces ramosus]
MRDVVEVQLAEAEALGADLVSVLVGANDLVGARVDPVRLADRLEERIASIRAAGADVLLVTPFMPQRPATTLFRRRFAAYNARLRAMAERTGSMLLEVTADSELVALDRWAEDRVHLNSTGHRGLAYAAARVLGVPDASELGALELAVHRADEDQPARGVGDLEWLRKHAAPWVLRRLRGRVAGDGRGPKRAALEPVIRPGG